MRRSPLKDFKQDLRRLKYQVDAKQIGSRSFICRPKEKGRK
jgi:hypothetical protein